MRHQPQGLLRVNWSSPLSRGLVHAALPGVNRALDALGKPLATTGTKGNGTEVGLAAGFGATRGISTADKCVTQFTGGAISERSYLAVFRRDGAGGGGLGRLFDKTNGSAGQILYWLNSGTQLTYSIYTGGTERVTSIPNATTAGVFYAVLVTHKQAGTNATINAWVNGAQVVTNTVVTGTLNDAASTALTIGNRNSDNARCWDGVIALNCVWDRVLSAEEAAKLYTGYWQLFESPDDLDEILTAANDVAIAESASLADLCDALIMRAADMAEAASAAETVAAGAQFVALAAENAVPADTTAASASASAVQSDAAAAGESPDANASTGAAVGETGSAADAVDWGGAVLSGDLTEPVSASDAFAASASFAALIAETAGAADALAAMLAAAADLAEVSAALDVTSGQMVTVVTLAELLAAADTLEGSTGTEVISEIMRYTVAPDRRLYVVAPDQRRYVIVADDRNYTVN